MFSELLLPPQNNGVIFPEGKQKKLFGFVKAGLEPTRDEADSGGLRICSMNQLDQYN